MCQAPIGKVIEVSGNTLTVEHKGKMRVLRSKIPAVQKGDYILFSTDIAIEKVDPEEAQMIGA